MFMVNVSHALIGAMRVQWPAFSVNDLKAWFRGRKYVVETLKLLPEMPDSLFIQQFPLIAQSPQTSASRRAFGGVRSSISLWHRYFCRHRGAIVSWKKTWERAWGALTPRRGHLVRDWRGKCTGKLESR